MITFPSSNGQVEPTLKHTYILSLSTFCWTPSIHPSCNLAITAIIFQLETFYWVKGKNFPFFKIIYETFRVTLRTGSVTYLWSLVLSLPWVRSGAYSTVSKCVQMMNFSLWEITTVPTISSNVENHSSEGTVLFTNDSFKSNPHTYHELKCKGVFGLLFHLPLNSKLKEYFLFHLNLTLFWFHKAMITYVAHGWDLLQDFKISFAFDVQPGIKNSCLRKTFKNLEALVKRKSDSCKYVGPAVAAVEIHRYIQQHTGWYLLLKNSACRKKSCFAYLWLDHKPMAFVLL